LGCAAVPLLRLYDLGSPEVAVLHGMVCSMFLVAFVIDFM
jgi:hypothetical protein